jgi:hypothetical protein
MQHELSRVHLNCRKRLERLIQPPQTDSTALTSSPQSGQTSATLISSARARNIRLRGFRLLQNRYKTDDALFIGRAAASFRGGSVSFLWRFNLFLFRTPPFKRFIYERGLVFETNNNVCKRFVRFVNAESTLPNRTLYCVDSAVRA